MSVQYSLRTVLDYLYRKYINIHLRSNDLLLLVWRSKGTMEDKVVASNTSYRAPKGPFWAKMGPFRVPVDPEGVRYQVKVCGDHESNQEELIEGSWDQIWPPGALQGPPGPPKGSFGPFWGRNEPFWGPQEYRRGPLRGQS